MPDYNQIYQNHDNVWGTEPNPLLKLILDKLPAPADVLDLGCGQGRDSIFMAQQGFNVLAVDQSVVAIAGLRQYAQQNKLANLHCLNLSLLNFDFSRDQYDVINIINTLHFLKKEQAEEILRKIKVAIKNNGFLVFSDLTSQEPADAGFFTLAELKNIFADFEILHQEQKLINDAGHPGYPEPHQHNILQLIARKNN